MVNPPIQSPGRTTATVTPSEEVTARRRVLRETALPATQQRLRLPIESVDQLAGVGVSESLEALGSLDRAHAGWALPLTADGLLDPLSTSDARRTYASASMSRIRVAEHAWGFSGPLVAQIGLGLLGDLPDG